MRSLLCLLLAAFVAGGAAFDILDPSEVVAELSEHAAGLERWHRPEFCGRLDCPPYQVRKHTSNYEIRRYDGGKWLVTNTTGTKFELAYAQATARLMKYFKGSNDKKEKLEMTTPTLAELKLGPDGQSTGQDYAFSLWLPEKFQKDTPQPTEAGVQVIEYERISVYVRVFGGFATEGTILKETKSLHAILDDEDRDFEDSLVWVAVYDPPQKLLSRHNEIHVPVAAKKQRDVAHAS